MDNHLYDLITIFCDSLFSHSVSKYSNSVPDLGTVSAVWAQQSRETPDRVSGAKERQVKVAGMTQFVGKRRWKHWPQTHSSTLQQTRGVVKQQLYKLELQAVKGTAFALNFRRL